MESFFGCYLESMDNSFINIPDDKEPKRNIITLVEDSQNFTFGNNKSQDNNIELHNLLNGLSTKSTMYNKNNKDDMNQIKTDEIYFNQIKKENKEDKENKENKEKKGNKESKKSKENKERKLLGRKKREDSGSGEHNKFSDDNLRRKVKHLVIDSTFKFINEKIKKIYNGNIGHGIFVKKLFIINQKQISEASIQFNKDFLNKTLGEIFSEDITSRITNYHQKHNNLLIEALTNEKDEDKKNYFKKLFSITFVDCLKHFRGTEKIEELEGMKGFNDIKSKYKDDVDYLRCLENYFMNYEEKLNNKKTRKSKKKEKEIN